MAIAIGLATVIYVAVSLGVFGTLTVHEVIAAGPTAIAVAAQPVLGDLGYWLMTVTALFATAGATNAGLYPATGLCDHLASTGQFPPVMARRIGRRASMGLLVAAGIIVLMVVAFDLSADRVDRQRRRAADLRARDDRPSSRPGEDRREPGDPRSLALATTGITLLTFIFTTLIQEPASMVTLGAILLGSLALDVVWDRSRPSGAASSA